MIPTNGMVVRWVVCILMLLPLLAIGKDKRQQEAVALLAKARELSDIRADDTLPFRLRARVLLWTSSKGSVEGSYLLTCASRNRWREEIQFPGFKQVRLRLEGQLWRSRNVIYQPLRIQTLAAVMDFPSRLRLSMWNEHAKRLFDRTRNNARTRCLDLQGGKTAGRTICFDPSSGVVVSSENRFSLDEFSEYAPWLGKMFPRRIRFLDSGKLALEVFVDQLAQEAVADESLFVPPRGAEIWPTCDEPMLPHALKVPEPPYPERVHRINAKVLVSIVVGASGKVERAQVLETPAPEFSVATTETVLRSWRFQPATCNGSAIPYEVYVEVAFRSTP